MDKKDYVYNKQKDLDNASFVEYLEAKHQTQIKKGRDVFGYHISGQKGSMIKTPSQAFVERLREINSFIKMSKDEGEKETGVKLKTEFLNTFEQELEAGETVENLLRDAAKYCCEQMDMADSQMREAGLSSEEIAAWEQMNIGYHHALIEIENILNQEQAPDA